MQTGLITLPRPEPEQPLVVSIRTGEFGALEDVLKLAEEKFVELADAEATSKLPDEVDRTAISQLVAQSYMKFYTKH